MTLGPRIVSCLKILDLITSAESFLPYKVPFTWLLGLDVDMFGRGTFFSLPQAVSKRVLVSM